MHINIFFLEMILILNRSTQEKTPLCKWYLLWLFKLSPASSSVYPIGTCLHICFLKFTGSAYVGNTAEINLYYQVT